jgi:hypothetical protein
MCSINAHSTSGNHSTIILLGKRLQQVIEHNKILYFLYTEPYLTFGYFCWNPVEKKMSSAH